MLSRGTHVNAALPRFGVVQTLQDWLKDSNCKQTTASQRAELVSVTTANEDAFTQSIVSDQRDKNGQPEPQWTVCTDAAVEGRFVWAGERHHSSCACAVPGKCLGREGVASGIYTRWIGDEGAQPWGSGEQCMWMVPAGWVDAHCYNKHSHICRAPFAPAWRVWPPLDHSWSVQRNNVIGDLATSSRRYTFVEDRSATWEEARMACMSLAAGADLVTLETEEEQAFVAAEVMAGKAYPAWIGCRVDPNKTRAGTVAGFTWAATGHTCEHTGSGTLASWADTVLGDTHTQPSGHTQGTPWSLCVHLSPADGMRWASKVCTSSISDGTHGGFVCEAPLVETTKLRWHVYSPMPCKSPPDSCQHGGKNATNISVYRHLVALCAGKGGGGRLASLPEYCSAGTDVRGIQPHGVYQGVKEGDAWAPFSGDGDNAWVQVGNARSLLTCRSHHALGLGRPTWGATKASATTTLPSYVSHVLCSQRAAAPIASPSPDANPAPPIQPQKRVVELVRVAGTTHANISFWREHCSRVPVGALWVVVAMGNVQDFYRPVGNATWCEMLTSNNKHMWNPARTYDTVATLPWLAPDRWTDAAVMGGSGHNWPVHRNFRRGVKCSRAVQTNVCPPGFRPLSTEQECRAAASSLGATFVKVNLNWVPKHCYTGPDAGSPRGGDGQYRLAVLYNTHHTGCSNPSDAPLCLPVRASSPCTETNGFAPEPDLAAGSLALADDLFDYSGSRVGVNRSTCSTPCTFTHADARKWLSVWGHGARHLTGGCCVSA